MNLQGAERERASQLILQSNTMLLSTFAAFARRPNSLSLPETTRVCSANRGDEGDYQLNDKTHGVVKRGTVLGVVQFRRRHPHSIVRDKEDDSGRIGQPN